MPKSHAEKLAALADLAIRFGLNLEAGQTLYLTAPTAALDFVRHVTEAAYKAGAVDVMTFFSDDQMALARFRHGSEAALDHAPGWLYEGLAGEAKDARIARLGIYGETPSLLSGEDPGAVARATRARAIAAKPLMDAMLGNTNWCVIAAATPAWGQEVFPEMTPEAAEERLWDLIFQASRIDRDDPVAAWQTDFEEIERRKSALNAAAFDALHFTGGGTDLTVGLAAGHIWHGGTATRPDGRVFAPNIPTEEVFTMPDARRTSGRAVFTKPAIIAGTKIEDLVVDFEDGRAVGVTASKGQEVVRQFLETDDGAPYLGEVALVAESSPVAQTDTLFLNTLFDENAACHIAFGQAYRTTLADDADPSEVGMNQSQIHQDCMIGHAGLDVDGLDADGSRTPVLRAGEFVI